MTAVRTSAWESEATQADGTRASGPDQAHQLQATGYTKCPTPTCDFWLSPQGRSSIENSGGYFTCPVCHRSTDLMEGLPWHGLGEGPWGEGDRAEPGGQTIIGLPLADQAQLGENLVQSLKALPGYGPIVWWHSGAASANSPLDGATSEWGIEVKTIAYDAVHHRFIPGRAQEKTDKNTQAAELGLQGVLGILVVLDYRRDLADIYVREMPLERGVFAFRKNTGQRLVAEVPFQSPYKDPNSPAPVRYSMSDFYRKPQPLSPDGAASTPAADMPF